MNRSVIPGRIVVGVDGSPASIDAVRWAARYAELIAARLEAVTSWVYPPVYGIEFGTGFEMAQVDWEGNARKIQETALQQALPQGFERLIRTVVDDHPAAALIAAAEGADLLVVGSRGHGGFAGALLGSVSGHVAAHASCAVVVVRHLDNMPQQDSETLGATDVGDVTSGGTGA
jgi:nucleotide-binding universal stress UspA family protein